jgi:magnesium and cobalt exporter, CNNM family
MNTLWILFLLIIFSGFFALAEMALASAGRAKLTQMADTGHHGAELALVIKEKPSRLLAGTQTGITAAALLMGIYGESSITSSLTSAIPDGIGFITEYKHSIAFTTTIVIITAISIVLGEIVPKRIAIAAPEKVASFCAPLMSVFLKILSPSISVLSFLSNQILSILPVKSAPAVTSVEDIIAYLDEGFKDGALAPEESQLLSNVLRLDDRSLLAIMTPVSAVTYIDVLASKEDNLKKLSLEPHSQLPVCKNNLQNIIGIAESHDILQLAIKGEVNFIEIPLQAPLFVPASLSLIDLLRTLRQHKTTFAFVVNEFGSTEGIVTLDDVMLSLVGDMMPLADRPEEALAVRRDDGSWLLDGLLPIDEMKDKLNIKDLPYEETGSFHTVGGYVLFSLGKIPKKSEFFTTQNWKFEVVDVDGNRVDQVLAIKQ